MTPDEHEKLPPEEKEHFQRCADLRKCSVDESLMRCCSITPIMRTGRTFSIQAGKSLIRTLPPRTWS